MTKLEEVALNKMMETNKYTEGPFAILYKDGFLAGAAYERERAKVLVDALDNIIGRVDYWTDEYGIRRCDETTSSIIARQALDAYNKGE